MPNYANQKKVELLDFEKIKHQKGSHNRFIQPIDYKWEEAAMRNLNGNAFLIWRYFLIWYGKGYVYFSPAAISREIGMGEQSATNSRKELEAKGYITQAPGKQNTYFFTPVLPVDYENLKNKDDFE